MLPEELNPIIREKLFSFLSANPKNLNCPLDFGLLPIHAAIQINELETVSFLAKNGADLNLACYGGIHPYLPISHAIALPDYSTMVPLLLSLGADINRFDEQCYPPIFYVYPIYAMMASGTRGDSKKQSSFEQNYENGIIAKIDFLSKNGAILRVLGGPSWDTTLLQLSRFYKTPLVEQFLISLGMNAFDELILDYRESMVRRHTFSDLDLIPKYNGNLVEYSLSLRFKRISHQFVDDIWQRLLLTVKTLLLENPIHDNYKDPVDIHRQTGRINQIVEFRVKSLFSLNGHWCDVAIDVHPSPRSN